MAHDVRGGRGPVRSVLVTVVVAAALLAGACANSDGSASGGSDEPRALSGVVPKPVPDVSAMTLPVAADPATPFEFVAEPGKLLIAYFGYTSCPDICPTTLADLKAALKGLGAKADDITVAMTTIDPRRDTGDVITNYVRSFLPDAVALRTEDDAALRAVATAFGADYKVEYQTVGEPQVLHSAYLYAVDDQGRIVLEWPFGSASKDISGDLAQLLA